MTKAQAPAPFSFLLTLLCPSAVHRATMQLLLPSQLPASVHRRLPGHGPRVWVPTTHAADPEGVLGSRFESDPNPAVLGIWGVKGERRLSRCPCLSLSLCFSNTRTKHPINPLCLRVQKFQGHGPNQFVSFLNYTVCSILYSNTKQKKMTRF